MKDKNSISARMKDVFQNHVLEMEKAGGKVIVSHFGELTMDLINGLTDRIENLIISLGDSKVVTKKMYSILIEGLENIKCHGERDEKGRQLCYLLIAEHKEYFRMNLSNIVHEDHYESIIKYIKTINSYDDTELNEKYQNAVQTEFLSHSGNAGLGLILTRRKTKRLLEFAQSQLDEQHSVFSFKVKLDRKS